MSDPKSAAEGLEKAAREVGDALDAAVSEFYGDIVAQLARIEGKVDGLVRALAEEADDDDVRHDLEGNRLPAERDPNEPL